MTREYRLVSADSHINEPPDLWTSRMASTWGDRIPRIESMAEGDAWILEGAPEPINFGRNCCAGKAAHATSPWCRWEDAPEGARDPVARTREQDLDGVDAEVLFPTPRIFRSVVANKDTVFHIEMMRAYNDWLSEYAGAVPDRLVAAVAIPNRGIDAAVAEVERTATMPGVGAYVIGLWPNGTLDLSPDDDRVWAAVEATGKPLCIHVQLHDDPPPGSHKATLREGVTRIQYITGHMEELIYGGVMRRFPALKVVLAEVDAGWVPYFREQADNRWRRNSPELRAKRGMFESPSTYMERMYFTYITDRYAVHNLALVGTGQLMWSSDYPHGGSDYPYSWRTIESDFYGIPEDTKHAVLAGNAATVFGLA
jgi:predicted TIM-barrel fold metal-dependent hydrolase